MTAPASQPEVIDGWTVRCISNVWVADHPEHGALRDPVDGRVPAQFNTRAELLKHLGVEE